MFLEKWFLIWLTLLSFIHNQVCSLSPPPRDPDWPGWHCRNYQRGNQNGKCIKVIHDFTTTPTTGRVSTFDDAAGICAKEKRDGDLLTPTVMSIESEDEEGFLVHRIMWGAGLFGGGNFGAWVAPSDYLTARLANQSQMSNTPSTKINSTQDTRPGCVLLQIDVDSKGPPGQPSGYGLNAKNISLNPTPCEKQSRVVCQTLKWTQTGLLNTVSKQKAELETLTTKFDSALKELKQLKESHCGVDPKKRVKCGWPKIEQWNCLELGCCFDNTVQGTEHCFNKVTDASKFLMETDGGPQLGAVTPAS